MAWSFRKAVKGNSRKAAILLAMRCTAIAALIIAAASPYMILRSDEEDIFFLIDRSASMEGTEEAVGEFISEAFRGTKDNQDVRVLSFAGDVNKEQAGGALGSDRIAGEPGKTDLEKALKFATASAGRDPARIVLISDGRETAGDALQFIRTQLPEDVTIDTAVYSRPETEDAAISSFTIPSSGRKGESQQLTVNISSTSDSPARLLLFRDDQPLLDQDISLSAGQNRFTFNEVQSSEGLLKYEAQIIMDGDGIQENNRMAAVTEIEGPPKVLIADAAEYPSPLADLIGISDIEVETVQAGNLPGDLSSYLEYDAIIFDNVPGHLVGEERMTVIEQAVKNFGTGFMMVGGEESFGLGGYFRTPVEEMLPVDMDVSGKQIIPSLGLVIVLDRSGSMMGQKMDMAKEAAARSTALLREDDTLGVIAFDESPWEVIETGPVGDPDEASGKIMSVMPGGGTDIYPAVSLAYERLKGLDLERKHIILLTDGMSAGTADYASLIEAGESDGVTMSTVAIGMDADRQLLRQLSEQASGRYYEVSDADSVPSILSRETAMLSRTYIVDEPFRPVVRGGTGWDALFTGDLPEMNAYIATTAKPAADVILESPKGDPVIAEGMYGLGRTLAYTSGSGGWSGGFSSWNHWGELWTTAVSRLLPQYRNEPFDIRRNPDGSYTVQGTPDTAFLDVEVVDEQGNELDAAVDPVTPGSVRVRVDTEPGLVFFSISGDSGTVAKAGVTIPYGEEYRVGPADSELLASIAAESGGQVLENPEDAIRPPESFKTDSLPAWHWFALAAMLIFFADITLRRFGLTRLQRKWKDREKNKPAAGKREESSIEKLLDAKRRRQ